MHISTAFLIFKLHEHDVSSIRYLSNKPTWPDGQKPLANCCWYRNPSPHARDLGLMPHFMQLIYQQFHSISPALSMHLFVVNLSFFSDNFTIVFSFLGADFEQTLVHIICSSSFKLRKHDVGPTLAPITLMLCLGGKPTSVRRRPDEKEPPTSCC